MRLEINANSAGALTINDIQFNSASYVSTSEAVLSTFKTVEKLTEGLSGGLSGLYDAIDDLDESYRQKSEQLENYRDTMTKLNGFLAGVYVVDSQVANLVNQNKDQFYEVNPWLRPPEEKSIFENGWDFFCKTMDDIKKGLSEAWEWLKETAAKAWEGLKEFYQKYKKIIDTVLVVIGAVLAVVAVIASGGLALAPLLGALGLSTSLAAAISITVGVIAVVSTVVSSTMTVADIWFEIDNPTFQKWKKALTIVSTVANLTYAVGGLYNSIKHINPREYVAANSSSPQYTDVHQLNRGEQRVITEYTMEGSEMGYKGPGDSMYDNINSSLRGNQVMSPENQEKCKILKNVLDNSALPEEKILFRGTSTDFLGEYKNLSPDQLIGKTVTEKAFMSTSTNSQVAMGFGKYPRTGAPLHMTIHAPAGAHALEISSLSVKPGELEYLFTCGQQMMINNAYKEGGITFLELFIK